MDSLKYPTAVTRVLRKVGRDIRQARLRRRIPTAIVAERASISRVTLLHVEKGEPGVAFGAYARVLFVLGLLDRLAAVADAGFDEAGLDMDLEELPKRIRLSKRERERR